MHLLLLLLGILTFDLIIGGIIFVIINAIEVQRNPNFNPVDPKSWPVWDIRCTIILLHIVVLGFFLTALILSGLNGGWEYIIHIRDIWNGKIRKILR